MTRKFLAAWTPLEHSPPYINFSEEVERGVVTVRGRERAKPGDTYGRDFTVEVDKADFDKLVLAYIDSRLLPS